MFVFVAGSVFQQSRNGDAPCSFHFLTQGPFAALLEALKQERFRLEQETMPLMYSRMPQYGSTVLPNPYGSAEPHVPKVGPGANGGAWHSYTFPYHGMPSHTFDAGIPCSR